ncbi:MAG: hypothetical protein QXU20_04795 [Candidatus Woesearchaeota archaeon]
MIYVGHPYYWGMHARYANNGYKRLKKYIDLILQKPPNEANVRLVQDFQLINKVYKATCDLIIHSYLTYEHFSLFVLTSIYLNVSASEKDKKKFAELEQKELKEKLKHILTEIIKKPELVNSSGYSMLFQELEQTRHAINHPKNENIYNCEKNAWDKVPLAWGMSGKALKFFEESTKLFNEMYKSWKTIEKKYSKPGILIGVQRGIKSLHTSFIKKRGQ